MSVFKPTGTTDALIKAIKPHIKGGELLDLACGSGIVGASLWKDIDFDQVYASDISPEAIKMVQNKYPYIEARCGNLFEPWLGMAFDYIVDDVSGVAEDIATISPWFDGVPCASGKDGADLVCDVLSQAHLYLEENGTLFFPIVSLSNVERIKDTASKLWKLELLSHTDFPLPKDIPIEILEGHGKYGIEFKEKFGMVLFYTDIYKATFR